jgi:hypothetical protein
MEQIHVLEKAFEEAVQSASSTYELRQIELKYLAKSGELTGQRGKGQSPISL